MDVDVVIVGAGPTGLMSAAELGLAGVRPLVVERGSRLRTVPRANGLPGQILEVLRYRGVLERIRAVAGEFHHAPAIPFGGVHLDLSALADSPLRAVSIPQPRLEQVLGEWAVELGAEVRRGHEVIGLERSEESVAVEVRGPDGVHRVDARYVVACDGGRSRVRDLAGIGFPGVTYPEVNRLGQVAVHETVTVLDNGDLDVPGLGRVARGFTRTERGVFAFSVQGNGMLMVQTTEDDPAAADDDVPMPLDELSGSIRRVLGAELPLGEPLRLSRYVFRARQAERYRAGRVLVAGDAAHQFPATGVGLSCGMLDAVNLAWKLAAELHGHAPEGLLDTYHDERHRAGERTMLHAQAQVALRRGQDPAADALRDLFQELCADEQPLRRVAALVAGSDVHHPVPEPGQHPLTGVFLSDRHLPSGASASDRDASPSASGRSPLAGGSSPVDAFTASMRSARPVLLDLADRADLREAAEPWADRVDIRSAMADQPPADALLIRPDAHVAWAAGSEGKPAGLQDALTRWFGPPSRG
jgi:2-polyprenyl-6-methoxyphenol hydroxylase-like FAD-dependent oxidoreductase